MSAHDNIHTNKVINHDKCGPHYIQCSNYKQVIFRFPLYHRTDMALLELTVLHCDDLYPFKELSIATGLCSLLQTLDPIQISGISLILMLHYFLQFFSPLILYFITSKNGGTYTHRFLYSMN